MPHQFPTIRFIGLYYFGCMKRLCWLPFAAVLLFAPAAQAQITITEADMPSAGDTVRYWNTTTLQDVGDTGPDHVWDFSSLVAGLEGGDTMVTVGSTPIAYQFFFNNSLLYPEHKASFAQRGQAIGFHGFSLSNLFDYYKKDGSGYRNVGFGANINGVPASVRRIPVDWIYRFPMNYGDEDSSISHFQISVPLLGFFGQDQMRHNEVDGWGTLILPTDTFQVLRVKSTLSRRDTVYIDQFSMGFAVPEPESVEYKWIAQGMDAPVLQVTTVAGVNTVVRFWYDPEDITTGVMENGGAVEGRMWPNPAGDVFWVEGMGHGPLTLINSDGRIVRQVPASCGPKRSISVAGLTPGTYLLRAVDTGVTRRVMIAR